ncbi:MAG: InlB B-repeat-containing protein [Bacillus subtilis]|nr:InlB B-repeat-containing protein [Bacillus subtilis]
MAKKYYCKSPTDTSNGNTLAKRLGQDLIDVESLIGETGNGIQSMTINNLGELVVTYTSGSTVNLGQILRVYTVSFLNIDGAVAKVDMVLHGQSATAPTLDAVEGYTFVEWSAAFTNVTANLVMESIYQIHTYSLTFNAQGGSASATIENIPYSSTVTLPLPTKEGYGFVGWYLGLDRERSKSRQRHVDQRQLDLIREVDNEWLYRSLLDP